MEHFLLNDFKTYKDMRLQNIDDDEMLSAILYGIEDYLKEQYGIYLKEVTVTKTLDIEQDGIVVLPTSNLTIQSIKINGKEYDVSDFYMKGNILKSKSGYLTEGIQNLEITYSIGFSNLPDSLKLAIFILADRIYERAKNNANVASSITDPMAGRLVFRENIPKEFEWLISPFISYYI